MTNLVTMWRTEQQEADEREQRRLAYIHGPLRMNPPELLAPTRCRVLKAFYLAGGKVAEVGAIVELQKHDADSMRALGRVEVLA